MNIHRFGKVVIGLCFTFCCLTIDAQTLTTKDFKLLIDGRELSDSTITVNELLAIKQVTTNFSWLSFKELVIYFSGKNSNEPDVLVCSGNTICDKARKEFRKLRKGGIVVFQAGNATNKSGSPLTVPDLVLYIK